MAYISCLALITVVFISSVSAYPRRSGNIQKSASGTCASIGYTTGCCPPDENCKATDGDTSCYCSADCHKYNDCCTDIMNVCPRSPTTCIELGFIDRCCVDTANMGFCEIETNDVTCSCQLSCFLDNTCCSDIGCVPTTCTEAGLDPGCCVGNCTVSYDTDEVCYCDERCHDQGDCCDDVDRTKQCNRCSLTIAPGNVQTKPQQTVPRPRLQPAEIVRRYQSRMRNLAGTSQTQVLSSTHRAYVDKQNMEREKLTNILETRLANAEVQRRRQRQ